MDILTIIFSIIALSISVITYSKQFPKRRNLVYFTNTTLTTEIKKGNLGGQLSCTILNAGTHPIFIQTINAQFLKKSKDGPFISSLTNSPGNLLTDIIVEPNNIISYEHNLTSKERTPQESEKEYTSKTIYIEIVWFDAFGNNYNCNIPIQEYIIDQQHPGIKPLFNKVELHKLLKEKRWFNNLQILQYDRENKYPEK